MPELVFYTGTMGSGKSTLALQTHHNYAASDRHGLLFTTGDRGGTAQISTRIGLTSPAQEVRAAEDLYAAISRRREQGERIDYLVCDEAQFYSAAQIEQLARIVDDLGIDVFAFGITTDFRTKLFPGAARLLELADRVEVLQAPALCWCGRRATHNARTVDGEMVLTGDQVLLGDTATSANAPETEPCEPGNAPGAVRYHVLCRKHHRAHQPLPPTAN